MSVTPVKLQSDLPRLAKSLINAADDRARKTLLRQQQPRFYSHLRRLAVERFALGRWGRSVNLDELAGIEIVDPSILRLIGAVTGTAMKAPGYHAGLQHTYGYLLSLIETPFGFKRDRWITSTIEDGFGLPANSLQAFPNRGTLLVNLTAFLSQLSLADQNRLRTTGAVASFDRVEFSQIRGQRIVEQANFRDRSNAPQRIEIRTDIIPFLHTGRDAQSLLVYTLRRNSGPAKLITTFPIGTAAATDLLDRSRLGGKQPIRLRFNAYLEGFPSTGTTGKRLHEELRPVS
jgi:hypothetical protein